MIYDLRARHHNVIYYILIHPIETYLYDAEFLRRITTLFYTRSNIHALDDIYNVDWDLCSFQ